MKNDWNTVSINDLKSSSSGSIAIGPFGSRMKSDCYVASGVPVIRGTNITGSGGLDGDFVYITEEKADSLGSSNVYKGDLVFPHRGSIGEVGIVQGDSRFVISSSLMKLTCDQSKVIPEYLYYFFKSHLGRHELLKNASQVGTPGIGQPLTSLKSIFVKIPQISEQKAITHILGSLDDKIELNRQINETLESMAQALFKSWFVDFDPVIDNALVAGNTIPDVFAERAKQRAAAKKPENQSTSATVINDSSDYQHLFPAEFEFTEEMGWIPLGWAATQLSKLVELIGGGTPKTTVEEYWNGDIPWFSVVDAPNESDVFVIDTEKHVTALGVEKSSTKMLSIGTTIISARGTVGKCAMVSRPMAMNQSCYGVIGKDGISPTYVYYSVLLSVSALQQRGHGSVFNTITRDTFGSINVAFGSTELTVKLDEIIMPLFDKILSNSKQSIALSKLRDTLLPKLLSGELRIPDAEKLVQEAML